MCITTCCSRYFVSFFPRNIHEYFNNWFTWNKFKSSCNTSRAMYLLIRYSVFTLFVSHAKCDRIKPVYRIQSECITWEVLGRNWYAVTIRFSFALTLGFTFWVYFSAGSKVANLPGLGSVCGKSLRSRLAQLWQYSHPHVYYNVLLSLFCLILPKEHSWIFQQLIHLKQI